MTKSPFINAASAVAYIAIVVLVIQSMSQFDEPEGGALVPMAMLALFVLSTAVMGYIFCLQPLQMYLDGMRKEAVDLFVKTVGFFACFTLVFFVILFLTA